jgi:hypothetical protein
VRFGPQCVQALPAYALKLRHLRTERCQK